jgi:hypothetical protein
MSTVLQHQKLASTINRDYCIDMLRPSALSFVTLWLHWLDADCVLAEQGCILGCWSSDSPQHQKLASTIQRVCMNAAPLLLFHLCNTLVAG